MKKEMHRSEARSPQSLQLCSVKKQASKIENAVRDLVRADIYSMLVPKDLGILNSNSLLT